MSNDEEHPDRGDDPGWRREPWWYGQAQRDYILLGFLTMTVIVSIIIFLLVVWIR